MMSDTPYNDTFKILNAYYSIRYGKDVIHNLIEPYALELARIIAKSSYGSVLGKVEMFRQDVEESGVVRYELEKIFRPVVTVEEEIVYHPHDFH